MRPTARLTLTILLAVLTAFVAGCGSDDSSTSSKASSANRDASTPAEDLPAEALVANLDAKLDIRLEHVASKDFAGIPVPTGITCTKSSPATCHGTLECPAKADDVKHIELCGWLAGVADPLLLAKPDPAQICTEQYGGPEVATVTGTIGDQKVDATFSRENGCAIGRFDEASPLWTGEVPTPTKPADGGSGPAAGSCPALPPDAPVSSDGNGNSSSGNVADPAAAGAADAVCASPATPGQPTPAPPVEPEIISDPPEAFE